MQAISVRGVYLLLCFGEVTGKGGCDVWCNQWTCAMDACKECGLDAGCPAKPPPPPPPPPRPSVPTYDLDEMAPGAIDFYGKDGVLYANGVPFDIKGVNWFGSENRAGPPLGLDKHNIAWYMNWLRNNKFNAIRLLFNHEMILNNPGLEPPDEEKYGKGAPWEAPELAHMTYLEMFKKIAEVAAEYGILILMAAHRLQPDAWPGNGLWHNGVVTEQRVIQSWGILSRTLCSQWNVFAVDLQNEPHKSSWGKGDPGTDWGKAAERLGDAVLTYCPRWLIFVEGVGYDPGAYGMDGSGDGIWWGENLYGVRKQPVALKDQSKLIFSPHTYGPSVYVQGYFTDAKFPGNMAEIWTERFEFTRKMTGSPVVIGEMGGHYTGLDKVWQDWAVKFMREKKIGIFYFTLLVGHGAQDDDTGGLLGDDWTSSETAKITMLNTLPCSDVLASRAPRPPRTPPPQLPPPPWPLLPPPPPPHPPVIIPDPKPPPPSPPTPPPPPPPPSPLPMLPPPSRHVSIRASAPPPPQSSEVSRLPTDLQMATAAAETQAEAGEDSDEDDAFSNTDIIVALASGIVLAVGGLMLKRTLCGALQNDEGAPKAVRQNSSKKPRRGAMRVPTGEDEAVRAEAEDDDLSHWGSDVLDIKGMQTSRI